MPNCAHPLARLFNMAARGLAYMLMHVKLSHYNLFTTQEFVTKLAADSDIVAAFPLAKWVKCALHRVT